MLSNPHQKYQQSSVQTASPGQLIVMLYDGAIRFVRQSIEAIDAYDIETANDKLIKAQNIIHELVASLDLQYAIATDLARIYEYMLYQLINANLKKDKEPALEVLTYLIELKETWVSAAKLTMTTTGTATHG